MKNLLQTIETWNAREDLLLKVRFTYRTKEEEPQLKSHGMSYLEAREYHKVQLNDIMGLDR
jgi:hypothetical protein